MAAPDTDGRAARLDGTLRPDDRSRPQRTRRERRSDILRASGVGSLVQTVRCFKILTKLSGKRNFSCGSVLSS